MTSATSSRSASAGEVGQFVVGVERRVRKALEQPVGLERVAAEELGVALGEHLAGHVHAEDDDEVDPPLLVDDLHAAGRASRPPRQRSAAPGRIARSSPVPRSTRGREPALPAGGDAEAGLAERGRVGRPSRARPRDS